MLAADFAARAVVWDEGFASSGGRSGMLRPDTVVMAWRGMQIALQAAQAGHDVVAAPVFPTYFDYYQERAETEPVAIGGPVRLDGCGQLRAGAAGLAAAGARSHDRHAVPGVDRVHPGRPGAGVHDLPAGLRARRCGVGWRPGAAQHCQQRAGAAAGPDRGPSAQAGRGRPGVPAAGRAAAMAAGRVRAASSPAGVIRWKTSPFTSVSWPAGRRSERAQLRGCEAPS